MTSCAAPRWNTMSSRHRARLRSPPPSSSPTSATWASPTPLAWLRAGEALERLWLEATRLDHVISLFTQVIEVPDIREELRSQLGLECEPLVLIRVGQAAPNAATNRRELDQMIDEL